VLGYLKRLVVSGAAYQFGDILAKGLALITLPLYTRHLEPSAYGAAESLLTAVILSSILLRVGVEQAFIRFYFDDQDGSRRDRIARTASATVAWTTTLAALPFLLLAALTAVYIVLGVLYESYIHPITIMSTLPSAGVGALAALLIFGQQLSIIAFIGIILLVGIVKKNAIMMIDVALHAERAEHLSTEDAIRKAALLRFRPITMTTAAAMLGALPLAIGTGEGAELRHPLGIAIVGGLIGSQALTLYTTPVVYIYLDHFGKWCARHWARVLPPAPPESVPEPGE